MKKALSPHIVILGEHVPEVCPFLRSSQLLKPHRYRCKAAQKRITEDFLWKMGRITATKDLWSVDSLHPCHHDTYNAGYMECPLFSRVYWRGRVKDV